MQPIPVRTISTTATTPLGRELVLTASRRGYEDALTRDPAPGSTSPAAIALGVNARPMHGDASPVALFSSSSIGAKTASERFSLGA